jgi:hypothetical protein
MKLFSVLILVALLFVLVPVALADDSVTSAYPPPEDDPVGDITKDIESLPDVFSLGVVVSVLVVVLRRAGLPDGWGGYANFAVGAVIFAVVKILPPDVREQVFEVTRQAAELLLVLLGGQITHASLKYGKLDKLWKSRDG